MTPQANAGAATKSAHASAQPAQAAQQLQQQQGVSSTKRRGSARAAQRSESSQKQRESAGSRRFTPAQQAVAAALMVVLKRAMKDGKEAALVVKHALKSNNIETRLLLDLLPNNGPLPTLQQIEQKMSLPRLLSLSNLAEQCKAANLKPLEVFTRSVQCTARRNAFGIVSIRSLAPDLSRDLQQLGAQQKLADLIVAYLQPLGTAAR
ncbi:g5573 [Coccomyxa viridis]|uniref:G5573 protein n=1 Tax=Coccomyxa viridis TaxID=1274662 RepID=A0ABP1FT74_9CHLO